MFQKHCSGNASGACGNRPYFPAPVVLCGCANDPSFGAVLGISLVSGGFVMDEGFHTKWNEGLCIVVVWAIEVSISRDFGVSIRLTQEVELPFHVRNELAPQVQWKFVSRAAKDGNEVVFPSLYGFFGNIAAVVIWWHQLVCEARVKNGLLVCR